MAKNRRIASVGLCLLMAACFWVPSKVSANTPAGVTVTPAALQLNLGKGQQQTGTVFTITNNYMVPVTLLFAFEPDTAAGGHATKPALHEWLHITTTELTVTPGASVQQQLSLIDNDTLPPGSQAVIMTMTQQTTTAESVGVSSSVRLPLTIVKEDGAVAAFTIGSMDTPAMGWTVPNAVVVDVRSSGNSAVIPRGWVEVAAPNGTITAQGALNSSSLALSPGGTLRLQTLLTKLANTTLPGPYKVTLHYGLGGGQATQTYTATLWYIAWWHVLGALMLGIVIYFGGRLVVRKLHTYKLRHKKRPPPKPIFLARRGSP